MSHRHKNNQWIMVQTTKKVSYIIILGIVISVLSISSILLQNGYQIHFKYKNINKGEQQPIKHPGFSQIYCPQSSYIPLAFQNAYTNPILRAFPWPFSWEFPIAIPSTSPSPIWIISIKEYCVQKVGFSGGFVKHSVSISAVSIQCK